jgi:hypothetical protein
VSSVIVNDGVQNNQLAMNPFVLMAALLALLRKSLWNWYE